MQHHNDNSHQHIIQQQQQHNVDMQHIQHMQHSQSTAVTVVSSNGMMENAPPGTQLIIDGTTVDQNNEEDNSVIIGEQVIIDGVQHMQEVPDDGSQVPCSQSSGLTPLELQNLQLSWPTRMWTNDLTLRLLEKVQKRKHMLFDPKLRRRTVYSEVAEEFQDESIPFTTSDIEKKYTSLLSTYRRNLERKSGSTWQYFMILEDIYSEVDVEGNKTHLPTSNLNPSGSLVHQPASTIDAASNKTQVRQSKRMRSRPARLKGHVDFSSESNRLESELSPTDTFDRVRELVHERLDDLQTQRERALEESTKAWHSIREEMDEMRQSIETLNGSVAMLAQTVSAVLNGLTKLQKNT